MRRNDSQKQVLHTWLGKERSSPTLLVKTAMLIVALPPHSSMVITMRPHLANVTNLPPVAPGITPIMIIGVTVGSSLTLYPGHDAAWPPSQSSRCNADKLPCSLRAW